MLISFLFPILSHDGFMLYVLLLFFFHQALHIPINPPSLSLSLSLSYNCLLLNNLFLFDHTPVFGCRNICGFGHMCTQELNF